MGPACLMARPLQPLDRSDAIMARNIGQKEDKEKASNRDDLVNWRCSRVHFKIWQSSSFNIFMPTFLTVFAHRLQITAIMIPCLKSLTILCENIVNFFPCVM